MRFFFSSRQFKIILLVVLAIVVLSVICIIVGGKISPQANIFGTIAAPFQSAATKISQSISDFVLAYTDGNQIMIENAELESQINDLREQLVDYEKIAQENEFYKKYLEINGAK